MHLYKILLPACLLFSVSSVAQTPGDTSKTRANSYNKVEVEASFIGGDAAWRTYLQKNLNPDVPADNGAPLGLYTVVAKFIVGQDGNLIDIQTETNIGYGMEKEVIRIIKNSGKWNPAIQDGKPVNAYRRQPVSFMLEEEGFEIYSKDKYYLYAGVDNVLNVDIKKMENENIKLTISQGTVTATGDGRFIARVTEPGRVIITAYNIRKNKELGKVSFEVRAKK